MKIDEDNNNNNIVLAALPSGYCSTYNLICDEEH